MNRRILYIFLISISVLAIILTIVIFVSNINKNSTSDSTSIKSDYSSPRPEILPIQPILTTAPSSTSKALKISILGDIMFDSFVGASIEANGASSHLQNEIKTELSSSDLCIANLETPLSERGTKEAGKQYTFRGKPDYVKTLTSSSINLTSLANNHILDFGIDALKDTLNILSKNNIGYAGAGLNIDDASKPLYINKNGYNIAFIASSHVIPFISWTAGKNKVGVASTYDPARTLTEIQKAKEKADIVIVYVHWGEEMKETLQYQKKLARLYIDKGADIVVGSHPHVLQEMEFYKNKIIAYSLGNFIFSDGRRDTMIFNIEIKNNSFSSFKIIPCEIVNSNTLLIKDKARILEVYKNIENISNEIVILKDGTVIPANDTY